MASSDGRLRLFFLCQELWQWCQSDNEDKNKGTNLPLQASDKFEHSQLAAAACTCSTTFTALLRVSFNTAATAIAPLPVPVLHLPANSISTSSSFSHFTQPKNDAKIANERSRGIPKPLILH